jgi:putative transposase
VRAIDVLRSAHEPFGAGAQAHVAFALEHVHDLLGGCVPVFGIDLAGQNMHQAEALLATWIQVAVGHPLERTQPTLPLGLGYVEGVTHDYFRHGTTTLFAALNVLDGSVITQCKPRHRHQEFLAFLQHLDRNIPADLDVHLVVDNYATHKHPKVKAWLARHPRYHLHFTPTYASWLNQVERWFTLITQRAIRHGSFRNVRQLIKQIEDFVTHYNSKSRPFIWTATADSILEKINRICSIIN